MWLFFLWAMVLKVWSPDTEYEHHLYLLEMQILRTYPRFPESETLRVGPSNLCCMKLPDAAAAHSGLTYYLLSTSVKSRK